MDSTALGDDSTVWQYAPVHVIVHILQYLDIEDKFRATAVCSHWRHCFEAPETWRSVSFKLYMYYRTEGYRRVVSMFGQYFQEISIVFNLRRSEHLENACEILEYLTSLKNNRMKSVMIERLDNHIIHKKLKARFTRCLHSFSGPGSLVKLLHISLRGIISFFDENLLCTIANNGQNLLSFSNWDPDCTISPDNFPTFVSSCPKLSNFSVCYCCVSRNLMSTLSEANRFPISVFKITCRGKQATEDSVSSEDWHKLSKQSPYLRVIMIFEEAFSSEFLFRVLKPEIPVTRLRLTTDFKLSKDLSMVANYYKNTLEELTIVPSAFADSNLCDALVDVVEECRHLVRLSVLGLRLKRERVKKVLDVRPGVYFSCVRHNQIYRY